MQSRDFLRRVPAAVRSTLPAELATFRTSEGFSMSQMWFGNRALHYEAVRGLAKKMGRIRVGGRGSCATSLYDVHDPNHSCPLRHHHGVSAKWLQAYLDEYVFRYNNRDNPRGMFNAILSRAVPEASS